MSLLTSSTSSSGGLFGTGNSTSLIIWIVLLVVIMVVFLVLPQRKQKKQREEMNKSLEPGDTVLTSSGFYGTVIDITDDTVIVEFGNNKNCRIPMQKIAISQIEKANEGIEEK